MKRRAASELSALAHTLGCDLYIAHIWRERAIALAAADRLRRAREPLPYPQAQMPAPVRRGPEPRRSPYPAVRSIRGGRP